MAVTVGPGLSMCLRVGVRKAQKISGEHGIPIVPVHHMEAHCLVARVKEEEWNSESVEIANKNEVAKFPFVALLVSGGHNVLLKVEGVGKYTILGQTLDDAIGEAYDKTARLLGLPVERGGAFCPKRWKSWPKSTKRRFWNRDGSKRGTKRNKRIT